MRIQPVLLDIQLTYIELLMIPTFIVAALYGYRRGWKEEALTSIGLLLALLLFSNRQVASLIAGLINRIAGAFRVFFDALFGTSGGDGGGTVITAENFATYQIISFAAAVILAYVVGAALGKRKGVTYTGKLLGAFIGILNSYVVLSKVYDFWLQRRSESGSVIGTEPTQIFITPAPETNSLRSNLPTIFAILFLLILVITFFRLPKIKH